MNNVQKEEKYLVKVAKNNPQEALKKLNIYSHNCGLFTIDLGLDVVDKKVILPTLLFNKPYSAISANFSVMKLSEWFKYISSNLSSKANQEIMAELYNYMLHYKTNVSNNHINNTSTVNEDPYLYINQKDMNNPKLVIPSTHLVVAYVKRVFKKVITTKNIQLVALKPIFTNVYLGHAFGNPHYKYCSAHQLLYILEKSLTNCKVTAPKSVLSFVNKKFASQQFQDKLTKNSSKLNKHWQSSYSELQYALDKETNN